VEVRGSLFCHFFTKAVDIEKYVRQGIHFASLRGIRSYLDVPCVSSLAEHFKEALSRIKCHHDVT
jgi:hypothetical protein